MEETNLSEDRFPPAPSKPLDSECCGTGCSPCVFEIYDKQLARWKMECDAIRRGQPINAEQETSAEPHSFFSVEEYTNIEISHIIQETETHKIFRFCCPPTSRHDFPVRLGQHVLLRLKGHISNQYTVLRVIEEPINAFDILIKIYSNSSGKSDDPPKMFTPLLNEIVAGDCLEIRGPFGNKFEYKRNVYSHIFMIAAGTGIAPMYRIIEQILENDEDETRIKLLFACSDLQSVPLTANFKGWSSHWNFDATYFIPSSSDPINSVIHPQPLPYYGMKVVPRRLDLENTRLQIKQSGCDLNNTMFLVCGTKPFEKDVMNYLSKAGVCEERWHLF